MSKDSMTFKDVIARLKAERVGSVDAVLNTRDHVHLDIGEDDNGATAVSMVFETDMEELEGFPHLITPWAHSQIAERTGVPMTYYRRCLEEAPTLLRDNLYHWWRSQPTNQLVRVVRPADVAGKDVTVGQPRVRAWLSDRYRVLDNMDFASTVLAAAEEAPAQIHEAHLDDQRLYLKLLKPEPVEVDAGDPIRLGLIARNSEVGDGSVRIQPVAYRLNTSSAIIAPDRFTRVHLGGKVEAGILSDEAIAKGNEAVWLQVRDWARYAFSQESVEALIRAFQEAKQNKLQVDARKAVHNVIGGSATADEAFGVLEAFLKLGDETQAGLASAVGAFAKNKAGTYSRQVELEERAGELAYMKREEFTGLVDRPATTQQLGRTFGG